MEDTEEEVLLSDDQKLDIAKWFLLNSPPGEIQYVGKDLKSLLNDEDVYRRAAAEAFPLYNKSNIISLHFPNRSGEVLVSSFSEISEDEYLDPRTAQVGKVDHVRQVSLTSW
ncbi:putative F-actin-capping protein subunit alpha [Helianthus annuus]|nr:putative F-actin-capping protein subunit alpha [Helianthus annuus]KAJ0696871.1 putative F-actin-capping protein subunit alpha [Helianthus annuus]KAJ0700311.1 putative F-actin-capping protein subunit alpha [Helianthus annuus]KAJ0832623.1 putative F-actin-capping protein subunit alpha [Helianthus annuus]